MTLNKKKILVVDDNKMSLRVYENGLTSDKCELFFCQSPLDAIEMIKEMDFDGVITDLVMPEVSGIELLSYVNKFQENCFKFLITGSTELDVIIHIVNHIGVDKIFLKPIAIDGVDLKESVNAYL